MIARSAVLSLALVASACGPAAPPRVTTAAVVLSVDPALARETATSFRTLRAALAAAPPGALIRLGPGDYAERVAISRPVILLGSGRERTRILAPPGLGPAIGIRGTDAVGLYNLTIEGGEVGVRIEGGVGHALHDVALRSFRIAAVEARKAELDIERGRVADVGDGEQGWGLDVQGGVLRVDTTELRRAGRRAIRVEGGRAELRALDVSGSQVAAVQAIDGADVSIEGGVFRGGGGAILYSGGARLAVRDAALAGGEYGIVAARGSDLRVFATHVDRYRVAGIATLGSDAQIERCRIESGGSEAGIAVSGAGQRPLSIVDVSIRAPGAMGIHATRANLIVRGAVITGATTEGGDFGEGLLAVDSELLLEDNVLRGNAGAGAVMMDSTGEFARNSFLENRGGGLRVLLESRARATRNLFSGNGVAGVEVIDRSFARLVHNRHGPRAAGARDLRCDAGALSQEGDVFVPLRIPERCAD